MTRSSRRDFIQKNIAGGVALALGLPLFARAHSNNASSIEYANTLRHQTYKDIDWELIRRQFLFPLDKNYLNTASLGPSPKVVVDAVCEAMRNLEVTCSHGRHLIDKTHAQLAEFLHAQVDELAIVRNATEGMNIIARSLRLQPGDEVILTTHEHVGGAAPWMAVQKDTGIKLKLVDLESSGTQTLRILENAITKKTKAVVFSHLTCTTGMKLPAKEIAAMCAKKGIYSCVDGAQAFGMFPINLSEMQPDFYTTSGHKWLFGPKGTGVLYINKKRLANLDPVFAGAYTDENYNLNALTMDYRRSAQREEYGTRNTPITLGLGTAVEFIKAIGIAHVAKRGRELSTYFRKKMAGISAIELLTPEEEAYSAAIITFKVKGIDNLALNQQLSREYKIRLRGIYENNLNAIRISFAIFNTFEEIDELIAGLKTVVKKNKP